MGARESVPKTLGLAQLGVLGEEPSEKLKSVVDTDLKLRPRHKNSEKYVEVRERPPQGLGQLILTLKWQLLSHFH